MKRNLLAVISAVLCGILAMFMPLVIWHQINFPDQPITVNNLRQEVEQSTETYLLQFNGVSPNPFYAAILISFSISIITYLFSRRKV